LHDFSSSRIILVFWIRLLTITIIKNNDLKAITIIIDNRVIFYGTILFMRLFCDDMIKNENTPIKQMQIKKQKIHLPEATLLLHHLICI